MKHITNLSILFLLVTAVLIRQSAFAQSDWDWAKTAKGKSTEWPTRITHDALGYIYMVGYYTSDTLFLDSDTLINYNWGGQSSDMFLTKYDIYGNAIWAKSIQGDYNEYSYGITTDINGNIFLTGEFTGGFMIFDQDTIFSNGNYEIFIAKFDSSGNYLKSKSFGGIKHDFARTIAVDSTETIFVGGNFVSGQITFDTITLYNPNSSLGHGKLYLAALDGNLNVKWVKEAGGNGNSGINNIVPGDSDCLYITGGFSDSIFIIGNDTLSVSVSGNHGFIIKMKNDGNIIWAKHLSSNQSIEASDICYSNSGFIVLAGLYTGDTLVIDSLKIIKLNNNYWNTFVSKLDLNGNALWLKGISASQSYPDVSITTDALDNVFIASDYNDSVLVFGPYVLNNSSTANLYDIFIGKYDASGNELWVRGVGNYENDLSFDCTVDLNNNLYITGWFADSTIQFGNTALVNTGGMGPLGPYQDMYVAKLDATTGYPSVFQDNKGVVVFPNPSNQSFKIRYTSTINSVTVYNTLNQMIYSKDFTDFSNERIVNSESFKPGFYLIKIRSNNSLISGKIIIE